MAELVYSRHHGEGLVVAEYSVSERDVSKALKEYDRTLRLVWEVDQRSGSPVWNVVSVWSPEHPAVQILTWRDRGTGDPLPLTMRIVDEVKRLRQIDTVKAADDANLRLQQQVRAGNRDAALAISEEHKPYIDRGRVSISTAQVRQPKPYWQRNKHLEG